MEKIAVVLFGITRNEKICCPRLSAVIRKLELEGYEVTLFTALNNRPQDLIFSKSKELLLFDDIEDLKSNYVSEIRLFGDQWNNEYISFDNLVRQLFLLKKAYLLTEGYDIDYFFFLRPDLYYHDHLDSMVCSWAERGTTDLVIPDFDHWGGLNDRFAFAANRYAASKYACRLDVALEMCKQYGRPLYSELLVKYIVQSNNFFVNKCAIRASRVRSSGRFEKESFGSSLKITLQKKLIQYKN